MKNERNLKKFPQCIADDIKRQVHELSTSVYQIRGHIKGKTLLPFPQVTKVYHKYLGTIGKQEIIFIFVGYLEVSKSNVDLSTYQFFAVFVVARLISFSVVL